MCYCTYSVLGTPVRIYVWSSHMIRSKGEDQPGKVANPARGQLNRGFFFFLRIQCTLYMVCSCVESK